MDSPICKAEEVMEMLGCSKSTLLNYKNRGILVPIDGVKPMAYSRRNVMAFIDGGQEFTPWEFENLKRENNRLREENRRLKAKFFKVQNVITVEAGDLLEQLAY